MSDSSPQSKVVGSRIPADDEHAISFWLPTWNDIIDNGEGLLAGKIQAGYQRFHIHPRISDLIDSLLANHDRTGKSYLVFPTRDIAEEAAKWVSMRCEGNPTPEIIHETVSDGTSTYQTSLVGVADDDFHSLKQYWRLSGQGISSRFASYLLACRNGAARDRLPEENEAKSKIRASIASLVSTKSQKVNSEDVYLYPNGLASLYNANRLCQTVMAAARKGSQTICFGFPFADTLKMLQHQEPANYFFAKGDAEELDALEDLLKGGQRFAALFCEVVSNPLMKTPDLERLSLLATQYEFLVVVDDTIAGYGNVDVLRYADISIASLTKIYNGACNLMAGALIVSPYSRYYRQLQAELSRSYRDLFWIDDAVELERNSRDFVDRNRITNDNAMALVDLLSRSPIVDRVYHPSVVEREMYDRLRRPDGGYGGVVSIIFKTPEQAISFYNALDVAKGPSLGANFTLCCPFVMLAHYKELEFAIERGVPQHLIRISVGLEETDGLLKTIADALQSAAD